MNYITWAPNPVIFKLGFLELRWYSLFFVGSFLIGYFIVKKIFIKEGKDAKALDDLLIYALLGAIIGARIVHCIFYEPGYYFKHPLEILYVWKGGLASHGGLLAVLLVFYLFAKKHKISYMWLLSIMTIPGSIVAASVRFGNFFNSEILGLPTNSNWGVIFSKIDNTPRHPVQLYEAFSYLLIGLIMYIIYKKATKEFATKLMPGLFALLLFSVRYFLEFFKTKQATYSLKAMSVGQALSLPLILLGIFWVIWAIKTTPKDKRWNTI